MGLRGRQSPLFGQIDALAVNGDGVFRNLSRRGLKVGVLARRVLLPAMTRGGERGVVYRLGKIKKRQRAEHQATFLCEKARSYSACSA